MYSIAPKFYQSEGFLSNILILITGSNRFFSYLEMKEKIGVSEIKAKPEEVILYPWLVAYPDEKDKLKGLLRTLRTGQPILILWKRNIFDSIENIRDELRLTGLTDIEVAYVLPNWLYPNHVVMAEGRALQAFYRFRQYSFRASSLMSMIKKFAYRFNLVKWTEKSLICWAKVK